MIAAGRFKEPAGFVFLHGRLFRQKGNGLVRVRCGGREVRRFVSGTGKPADEVTISLFREAWRLFRNSYFCDKDYRRIFPMIATVLSRNASRPMPCPADCR